MPQNSFSIFTLRILLKWKQERSTLRSEDRYLCFNFNFREENMAIISSLNNHVKSVQKAKQMQRILNSPVLQYFYPIFIFSVNDYITLIAFQLSVN